MPDEEVVNWKTRGDGFIKNQQFEEAIQCYEYAVHLDPGYISAWNNLGYSYSKIGKKDEAREIYQRIEELKNKRDLLGKPEIKEKPPNKKILTIILAIAIIILGSLSLFYLFGLFTSKNTLETQISKDPIIGVWKEDLTTSDDIFPHITTYIFSNDGNLSIDSNLSISGTQHPVKFSGKWIKINENQYIVSFLFTENTRTFIYNPQSDTLYEPEYPSIIIYREDVYSPRSIVRTALPTTSPVYSNARFRQGSIVLSDEDKKVGYIVLDVDYEKGLYKVAIVERPKSTSSDWYYSSNPATTQWVSIQSLENERPLVIGVTNPTNLPYIDKTRPQIVGFNVKVDYSGEWQGALGINGNIKSIEGHGPATYELNIKDIDYITINAQKMESTKLKTLSVYILENGEIVASQSTSASYGVAMASYSNY